MRRETALGLMAAGGIVVIMMAVFTYGLAVYEPARFDVAWSDTEHTGSVDGPFLSAGDARPHAFEAEGTNVTSVRVVLEWDDPVGPDNDVFELSVEGPGDRSDTASDAAAPLTIDFAIEPLPDQSRVEGANAAHALDQLERPDDMWEGVASWDVVVRLVSADGDEGTQDLGVDPTEDDSNDYTVRFVRITTNATLTPR